MKEYDAYLFDWDGTLAKTVQIWIDALRTTCAEYGLALSEEDIMPSMGNWTHALQLGISEAELPEFKRRVIQIASTGTAAPPLFEDGRELLKILTSRGKRLALISTSPRHIIDTVVAHHDLAQYFDIVIADEDVHSHKPDPEGIHKALTHFGIDPERAIMIGDSDKDLGAAKNAGIDSLLFYPEEHHPVYDREYLVSFEPVRTVEHWSHLVRELA